MKSIFGTIIIVFICVIIGNLTNDLYKFLFSIKQKFNVYIVDIDKFEEFQMNNNGVYIPVLKKDKQSLYDLHVITVNISNHIAFNKPYNNLQEVRIYINNTQYFNIAFQTEKEYLRYMQAAMKN